MRPIAVLLVLLMLPGPAFAGDGEASVLDRAGVAYREGEWERAERLALEADGARGHMLAAEAVLAALMTWKDGLDRPQAARTAQEHAEEALARDDTLADAHLRLAAALGYRGRFMPAWRAWLAGIPQQGRDHILTALELDPDDPWAHALYGAWHMEVARRGGEGTLGASLQTGLAHYRSAARSAPDEPGIAYHLAIAQVAADPDRFADEAASWLDQAASAEVEEAFDRQMKQRAQDFAGLLARDRQAAREEAVYRLEN